MRRMTTWRRYAAALSGLLIAGATGFVTPAEATTTGVAASAYGVFADVTPPGAVEASVGPAPAADFPSGPAGATVASVGLSGVVSTGAVTATVAGDQLADTAEGSAQVAGVNLVSGLVTADAIGSTCTADGSGVTAASTLSGASAGLVARITLATHPAPNTTVTVTTALGATVAILVLNEQTNSTAGGVRSIGVNALHLTLLGGVTGSLGTGEVIVGHSSCQAVVPVVPTVSSVSPAAGPVAGGTTVTVSGTGFAGATAVTVDGVAVPYTVLSATQVRIATPAHAAGPVDVRVATPAGTSAAASFTYAVAPAVAALTPSAGPEAGGTTVTITGTGLSGASAVDFGGTPASFTVDSDTQLTATSPAGTGAVTVAVTTQGGTATARFDYVAAPVLTALSPASGPESGGTTVTMTGAHFAADGVVEVDGTPVPFAFVDATEVRIASPAHAAGNVAVTVRTPGGTSSAQTFSYLAVPAASGPAPDSGPAAGGTLVTFTGTGLDNVTAVELDGTPATVTAQTSASLTVTTPAHPSGPVGVVLTGPAGVTVGAGTYTYTAPAPPAAPSLTGLSQASGPVAGGTAVTLTGAGFTAVTAVHFGDTTALYVVVSDTEITATSPTGSGNVTVNVTGPGGTSATSEGTTFAYLAPPTLSSLSPASGPASGGTTITLSGSGLTPADVVLLDGVPAPSTYLDGTSLRLSAPPHAAGAVAVTISGAGGTSAARTFTYVALPVVSGLDPDHGSTLGGTNVTIAGTGLDGVDEVTVDGVIATITGRTSTALTISLPAHGAGPAGVVLTGPADVTTDAGVETYVPPAPQASAVAPDAGPQDGGTVLTVSGSGFTGATTVTVGGVPATGIVVVDDTTITATSPASTDDGTVAVVVTGPGGSDSVTFTYVARPVVEGISPATGPLSGGTTVTVTGTGLTGATTVTVDGVPATGVVVVDDTTITATSPAALAGPGHVQVGVPVGGTSSTTDGDVFTYLAAPAVTGISPDAGTGGTTVTVTGTALSGVTEVGVGDETTGAFTITGDTSLTFTVPDHAAGTVDVVLTGPGGAGAPVLFTYLPAPVVADVSPGTGPTAGGTLVTITGTGLSGATVDFGGQPGTGVSVAPDGTALTVTAPAHTAGDVAVTVTTPGGSAARAFTYLPVPAIDAVSPASGPAAGGSLVTITGSNLTDATAVSFDGIPGTDLTVDGTGLTAVAPAHAAGSVDVRVTTPAGTTPVSVEATYTYLAPGPPDVTDVSPDQGAAAGGTSVEVTGSGLSGATHVTFGDSAGTDLVVVDDNHLTVVTPAGSPGTVDVTVTTPNGTGDAGMYTYENPTLPAAPVLTSLVPDHGPVAGGTSVTVTGAGLSTVISVTVGGEAAQIVGVPTDTTLTFLTPAHAAGAVDVILTTPFGSTGPTGGAVYTYEPPAPPRPVVLGLDPDSGPAAGGTSVTITGSGFTATTAVTFGDVPATEITVVDDTHLVVVAPPHIAGTVDVAVTTAGGTSVGSPADAFTYSNPASPAITGIDPPMGPTTGGTTVTITGSGFALDTVVTFDGIAATILQVGADGTMLVVTAPAHPVAGPVDLVVTTAGGSATASFTYVAAPAAMTVPARVITGHAIAVRATGWRLTITACGTPRHGTVRLDTARNACVYTAPAGWTGLDQFGFTVRNLLGATAVQRARVTVIPAAAPATPVRERGRGPAVRPHRTGNLPATGADLLGLCATALVAITAGGVLLEYGRGKGLGR